MQIWFYHLQRRDVLQSLPDLLVKILTSGQKAVILGRDATGLEALSNSLWQGQADSWLPHGPANSDHAENQPLVLTMEESNPGKAKILITIDGAETAFDAPWASGFDRIFDMFDGNDPMALDAARNRWRRARDSGADLAYWQQTDSGGWQRKQ